MMVVSEKSGRQVITVQFSYFSSTVETLLLMELEEKAKRLAKLLHFIVRDS